MGMYLRRSRDGGQRLHGIAHWNGRRLACADRAGSGQRVDRDRVPRSGAIARRQLGRQIAGLNGADVASLHRYGCSTSNRLSNKTQMATNSQRCADRFISASYFDENVPAGRS